MYEGSRIFQLQYHAIYWRSPLSINALNLSLFTVVGVELFPPSYFQKKNSSRFSTLCPVTLLSPHCIRNSPQSPATLQSPDYFRNSPQSAAQGLQLSSHPEKETPTLLSPAFFQTRRSDEQPSAVSSQKLMSPAHFTDKRTPADLCPATRQIESQSSAYLTHFTFGQFVPKLEALTKEQQSNTRAG